MDRAMAEPRQVTGAPSFVATSQAVLLVRIFIVAAVLAAWEAVSASGLLFQGVVPSLLAIGAAVGALLADADFYRQLGVAALEVGTDLVDGGVSGIAGSLVLGVGR